MLRTTKNAEFGRVPTRAAAILGALAMLASPAESWAQEEDDRAIDIDVRSSRIGGPGLSAAEKRQVAAMNEPEEYLTEETLPPKGSKKRLPALHKLARQYVTTKMWKEACDKYDTILDEADEEGLASAPDGKANASRSYYYCAKNAFVGSDFDKTRGLLKKSEKYGTSDYRHASLRRKMLREDYRSKFANGDVEGGLQLFAKYQAEKKDDDERIWVGEQLAKLAWTAYQTKNKTELKRLMRHAEEIAPMNTEYRRLKEKVTFEESVFSNLLGLAVLALLIVGASMYIFRWRARKRIEALTGGPLINPLDDDV